MIAKDGIKNLENSSVELTLTVSAEKIEAAYKESLKKYAAKYSFKGFRPGKAPVAVVEQKIGKDVREESTYQAMEEQLHEDIATLEQKLRPLTFSVPVLQNEESLHPFKANEDITFSVVYDILPVSDVETYKGLDVEYVKREATQADLDAVIERHLDNNAIVKTKEGKIADGDLATITYVELDEKGAEVADTKREGISVTVGANLTYYSIDADLVGMSKDEEKIIAKSYKDDEKSPQLASRSFDLKVIVEAVKTKELPELDDDLAQDINQECKTVAELLAHIKTTEELRAENMNKNSQMAAILEKLTAQATFTIPASMVDFEVNSYWRDLVKQFGGNEEGLLGYLEAVGLSKEAMLADQRANCELNIKNQMILLGIQEKEKFEISEDDIKKVLDERYKGVEGEDKMNYNLAKDELEFEAVIPFLLENNNFIATKTLSLNEVDAPVLE